jgi:hypothetical protein
LPLCTPLEPCSPWTQCWGDGCINSRCHGQTLTVRHRNRRCVDEQYADVDLAGYALAAFNILRKYRSAQAKRRM